MKFDLKKPCEGCPFLKNGPKAVRLRVPARAAEVWRAATHDGPSMPCHKTFDYEAHEDGRLPRQEPQHCLGAILSGVASGEGPNQISRIMCRLGAIKPETISDENLSLVFDSKEAMAASSIEPRRARKKGPR